MHQMAPACNPNMAASHAFAAPYAFNTCTTSSSTHACCLPTRATTGSTACHPVCDIYISTSARLGVPWPSLVHTEASHNLTGDAGEEHMVYTMLSYFVPTHPVLSHTPACPPRKGPVHAHLLYKRLTALSRCRSGRPSGTTQSTHRGSVPCTQSC